MMYQDVARIDISKEHDRSCNVLTSFSSNFVQWAFISASFTHLAFQSLFSSSFSIWQSFSWNLCVAGKSYFHRIDLYLVNIFFRRFFGLIFTWFFDISDTGYGTSFDSFSINFKSNTIAICFKLVFTPKVFFRIIVGSTVVTCSFSHS